MIMSIEPVIAWEPAFVRERPQLVRLCAALTGASEVAEDLAQETLVEAWRNVHKLHDPHGLRPWLVAIARNVCLRWRRKAAQEAGQCAGSFDRDATPELLDDLDLERDLERDELADLLDRALALLPPETRAVLLARYVQESSQAEVAARLGLSEGAVAMRLQRGKLALRRVLATDLRGEAAAYGLVDMEGEVWQATRIWCPICGQVRLMGRFDHDVGEFTLRCAHCVPSYRQEPNCNMAYATAPQIFAGVRGFKPALSRLMAHGHDHFKSAVEQRRVSCLVCGQQTTLFTNQIEYPVPPSPVGRRGVWTRCTVCGATADCCLSGIALWSPQGRQFWAQHTRIRLLAERDVSVSGQPAIQISFQSLTSHGQLDVLLARETSRVLVVAPTLA